MPAMSCWDLQHARLASLCCVSSRPVQQQCWRSSCQTCSPGKWNFSIHVKLDQLILAHAMYYAIFFTGTYANMPDSGATLCNQCLAGEYQDSYGATSCKTCPAGTITGASGQSSCTPCQGGSYQPNIGSSGCINADLGYYSHGSQSVAQYTCPYGSYTDVYGSSACTCLCPRGQSTYQTGSKSSSDCLVCPNGVDPNTLACLSAPAELDDVCWDPGQILSLDRSVAHGI